MNTHITHSMELGEPRDLRGRLPIITMKDAKVERHTGSKQVIKHCGVSIAVGLVDGVIGIITGVCVRLIGE